MNPTRFMDDLPSFWIIEAFSSTYLIELSAVWLPKTLGIPIANCVGNPENVLPGTLSIRWDDLRK
jgi:hypothetical protein